VSVALPTARPAAGPARWLPIPLGLALFALALALRFWGIAQSVTADDQDWVQRAAGFGQAIQKGSLRNTYQSGHPGVPVLWIASLVISPQERAEIVRAGDDQTDLERTPAYLPVLARVRRVLATYAAMLTVLIAFLTARLFGAGPGLLAGLLLAAEPFLVAHGQLFSTDTLLTLLMTTSVLAALVFFDRRGDAAYLIGSGVAAGLAFSTKAPAIVLFGCVPLIGLGWLALEQRTGITERRAEPDRSRPRTHLTDRLLDLLIWGIAAGLIYLLVWPALWVDPLGTLLKLEQAVRGVGESPRRWGNFFLGQVYPTDDVPLLLRPVFYPIVTALRLSPITFVGLLVLAGLGMAKRWHPRLGARRMDSWRPDRRVLALAAFVLLFAAMMTISPKKLDRYGLPIYPSLVILAAVGLWWAIRRWLPARWAWPAVVALGLGQVALVAQVEPYPLSFYNPLLGGASMARRTMIVGWGEGLDQVAAYLNQQPDAEHIVAVSLYKDQLVPLFRGRGARLPDWQKGTHFVSYVNMDQRDLIPAPLQEWVDSTPPDYTVRLNGIVYARVYRIPPEIRQRAGPNSSPLPNDVPRP
jgi:4-amino-4-deoxy-L-arabinose transferase-like glycosyltransferase